MKNLQLYDVAPSIPAEIRFLEKLAHNLWWCWNPNAIELFRRISPELWAQSRLNPLEFLRMVPQDRIEALAKDEGFLRHLNEVRERFEAEAAPGGRKSANGDACVCYFSLEYGLHESVRLYSGGLGVLAGDHLKAASDLNLPLAAVGLLYNQGYFRQYLDERGMQQETYPDNQIHLLPLAEEGASLSAPLKIAVPMPEGQLKAAVWRLNVGRIPLYLLDTNIADNPPEFREITAKLYGGDRRMRLRQELLLGVGGVRALLALGHEPGVCHMNEGHAAFLSIARIAHLMQTRGLTKDAAFQVVSRTNVFTTHTPVPAGNETFPVDLLAPHLHAMEGELGLHVDDILPWTRPSTPDGAHYEPSMTVLGLRTAEYSNGVSKLHGLVARRMWAHLWPERPIDEVPIGHVTNGVHVPSWVAAEYAQIFDHYLGPTWRRHPDDADMLARIDQIPDDELWHTHDVCRSRLIRTTRDLLERQLQIRNATRREVAEGRSVLDHGVLTLGFARRFATYKRATLLLRDPDRLVALLTNRERPVQLVFAGKAHPADNYGKDFIRQIVEFAHRAAVSKRIVFLENYDINIARRLVQGADVWLNTPRRPQEASGTSGMKAALNGVLNASILDGWWCEGYKPECGWAIGGGEEFEDHDYQDMVESQALFNLLENEIIPCFYDRAAGDTPPQWARMMKASMRMALGFFTSHRMVAEYANTFYKPAMDNFRRLTAGEAQRAQELVAQHQRLQAVWRGVQIEFPAVDRDISSLHVGDKFTVSARVQLGELRPEEVDVEVYYGPVSTKNQIVESRTQPMKLAEELGEGWHLYRYKAECRDRGRFGLTARVTPRAPEWKRVMPGFMTWAVV